jgi:hypothetical protein
MYPMVLPWKKHRLLLLEKRISYLAIYLLVKADCIKLGTSILVHS